MALDLSERWIEGITPNLRTSEAAGIALENRFQRVLHYLPLAAKQAEEDIEYVHHLRVWTRRATAALRLYEEWIPRRQFNWMKKQLKHVRRAANDARDCDILIQRLESDQPSPRNKYWHKSLKRQRQEAQSAIIAIYERLNRGHQFEKKLNRLLETIDRHNREMNDKSTRNFGQWARKRLWPLVEAFFAAVPHDPADVKALHLFRIQGKELRYAMEVLAGAFPDDFRTRLYPIIATIQEHLGEVNDHVTGVEKLEDKLQQASKRKKKLWRTLLVEEQTQLTNALQQFWLWCKPGMLEELQANFDSLLARSLRPAHTLALDRFTGNLI